MPPESARAVARARSVGKIGRNSFRFLLAEKWKKNVLIIYAPRECPSGSEGQICGENWPEFVPVFIGRKVEKKCIDNICPPRVPER